MCRGQVGVTLGPLGADLRLLVAVVLFGEVQVRPQRPQQRGSEPDPDVQSTALPALLDEKLADLGGHLLRGGTVREAEPNGIVECLARLLVPFGGGAPLPDVVKGEEVAAGGVVAFSPVGLAPDQVHPVAFADKLHLLGLARLQAPLQASAYAAKIGQLRLTGMRRAQRLSVFIFSSR